MPARDRSVVRAEVPLLFVCPYCGRPAFLPIVRDASTVLWLLRWCPTCGAQLSSQKRGHRTDPASIPYLVERVAVEMREGVRIDPVSHHLDFSALGHGAHPLRRDYVKDERRLRNGVPPDLLMWIGAAVASGVLGNLAYDSLKSLIKLAFRSRWGPRPEITQWNDEARIFQTFNLSERQIQGIIRRFAKYSEVRLKAVRSRVEKLPGGRRKLDYAMPAIQPVMVTYLDAKGRRTKHPKQETRGQRRPRR